MNYETAGDDCDVFMTHGWAWKYVRVKTWRFFRTEWNETHGALCVCAMLYCRDTEWHI